jgi:DNA ligase-1
MKFKLWEKEDLKGSWEISIKIDGVRCHKIDGQYISRKNKPLYNIPDLDFEVAEIFCGSFKTTIENVRTFTKEKTILSEHVYTLSPEIDDRLLIGEYINPSKEFITSLFNKYHNLGHEGLILRQGDKRLKVKNEETYDVKILNIFEGKGRLAGKLGGFITEMGNVGTGLNDEERVLYFNKDIIGETLEVECMQLTPDGKFRHPRFVRIRYDK